MRAFPVIRPPGLRNAMLVVGLGFLIGLSATFAFSYLRMEVTVLALVGLVMLYPTFVLKSPLSYWLTIYVVLLPFDIHKRLSGWLVSPYELFNLYGMPPTGSLSLDLYLSDVALVMMIAIWVVELCLKKKKFYFPKVGYIFLLYLAWALICSLINAKSLYMSGFEWLRQAIYFISFLYIANVVKDRLHFRIVVIALIAGLTFQTGAVITKFQMGLGSEVKAFSEIYRDTTANTGTKAQTTYAAEQGEGTSIKRSSGTFSHPALAAYYLEYIMPLVLVLVLTLKNLVLRSLLGGIYLLSVLALILTFSRTGFVAFVFGVTITLSLVRWRNLIPRKPFAVFALVLVTVTALLLPFIIDHLTSRPEAFQLRFILLEKAISVVLDDPFLGAGLNHATAAMPDSKTTALHGKVTIISVVHNHYVIVLIEVGLIGFLLNFGFFWRTIQRTVHGVRYGDPETVAMSIGIIGGIASIAMHNMGDPFGGHTNHAMLWLFMGVGVALDRRRREMAGSGPAFAEREPGRIGPVAARTAATAQRGLSLP